MTERDELLSAALDGTASPDERAAIAADPALSGELARLTTARDELRRVDADVEVDPFTRRRHLAAAGDAFDALQLGGASLDLRAASSTPADDGASAIVADVVAMNRPDRRRRPLGALVGAAAAIILAVGVAGPLVGGGDDDSSGDAASAAFEAADTADAAEAMTADAAEEEMATASADDAMEDESADAMDAESADDAMVEAESIASTEVADDDEAMDDSDSPAEGVDDAEESDTTRTDADVGPVVVEPSAADETLAQMADRLDAGIESVDAECATVEGATTLHVAPGISAVDGAALEVHLHVSEADETTREVTIYRLPSCELL